MTNDAKGNSGGVVNIADHAWKNSKRKKGKNGPPAGGGSGGSGPELIRRRGEIVAYMGNVYQILKHHPDWAGVLAFDEFAQRICKLKSPPYDLGAAGEWDETDDARAAIWLSRQNDFTPSSACVFEAITVLAKDNSFHPVRTWLRGLPPWDGTPRLVTWLAECLGVDKSKYTELVGRFFLTGMVARVFEPGCKFDYCLVLEGPQGKGKSTALSILGGEWFGDTDLDLHNKDSMSAIRGKWLYEFAEIGSLARAETTRQKSFLSRRFDEFRPPYGRREIRCARQGCFAGTTNEWEWNKDPTGGRRFWPIECKGQIQHAMLRESREQLFAEALAAYDGGEQYWPTPAQQVELFDPEQLRREKQDSLVDALHDWVFDQNKDFSLADAVISGLKLDAGKLTRDMETRVGIALRKLGCTKVDKRNGMVRFWYRPPVIDPDRAPGRVSDVPF